MLVTGGSEKKWLVVRHVELEDIGTLASAFENAGIAYRYCDVFRGDPVPNSLADLGGIVIMGGPMGVYEADRYPFLRREMDLIRRAADEGVPMLGICLGSQLVAQALGGRVYPGSSKEIGWHPVEVVAQDDPLMRQLPKSFTALHWHGDTFDLPAGAVHLCRSKLYENQAFRWGRNVYCFQFHLEIGGGTLDDWLENGGCQAEIASVPGLSAEVIRRDSLRYVSELERLSSRVFSKFLSIASSLHTERGSMPQC